MAPQAYSITVVVITIMICSNISTAWHGDIKVTHVVSVITPITPWIERSVSARRQPMGSRSAAQAEKIPDCLSAAPDLPAEIGEEYDARQMGACLKSDNSILVAKLVVELQRSSYQSRANRVQENRLIVLQIYLFMQCWQQVIDCHVPTIRLNYATTNTHT